MVLKRKIDNGKKETVRMINSNWIARLPLTIDDMVEFLVFVQNNGVHDLSFVEEAYKSSIFADDEFLDRSGIIVCSVEEFVDV